jgi:hypothetical protein
MKNSIAKAALAIGIGLATATSSAFAGPGPRDSVFTEIKDGSVHFAKNTWEVTKDVSRTVVHSPVIAYQVARGERPLFTHETASREDGRRQQIALTGHHSAQSQ